MKVIPFEMTDEATGLVFRDAIWLTDDDQSSDVEIEGMKTERFKDWLKAIQPEE
jgi:hypothetical protein